MNTKSNPALVNVYRKNIVESCHRGSAIVVDYQGQTVFSVGDTDRKIYPRSSLKLLQAIPLLETGAADQFNLSEKEIALACASHNGESIHTETVTDWLARLGLTEQDLENGPTNPLCETVAYEMYRQDIKPTRIHQNCSGKHTGMLTLAKHMGVETKGYSEHSHPVQQAWMKSLSELVGVDVVDLDWERDGCGMPAICLLMGSLAFGYALFARPQSVGGSRQGAMESIASAIRANPQMIAGTDRCCTDVISRTDGAAIVKTGAEAVYAGFIPGRGLGFALKIDDGSSRGSEVALGALLRRLGVIDDKRYQNLRHHFEPDIINSQNEKTGKVVPAEIWNEL